MAAALPHQHELLIRKARSDIHIAKVAVDSHDETIDDATILFHVQQAIEKTAKALLSANGVHFEKIHDLVTLAELCRSHSIDLPQTADRFAELNPFAVVGRYGLIEPGEVDVPEWIRIAEDFFEGVAAKLGS